MSLMLNLPERIRNYPSKSFIPDALVMDKNLKEGQPPYLKSIRLWFVRKLFYGASLTSILEDFLWHLTLNF